MCGSSSGCLSASMVYVVGFMRSYQLDSELLTKSNKYQVCQRTVYYYFYYIDSRSL
jgi:hypothetical protein